MRRRSWVRWKFLRRTCSISLRWLIRVGVVCHVWSCPLTSFRLVSARARQLNHRLKNRRNAIVTRRENDSTLHSSTQPSADIWRDPNVYGPVNGAASSHPSTAGFLAVNAHRPEGEHEENPLSSQFMFSHSNTDNVT